MNMILNRKKWHLAWSRLVQLSSESTAHGYHNIYRTSFWPLRFMWIVLFVGSIGFCASLVIGALTSFFQYDVTTKIRLEYESSLDFPMISMCNTKPFLTKTAYDYTIKELVKLAGPDGLDENETTLLYGNTTGRTNSSTFYGQLYNHSFLLQNKVADPLFNKTLRKLFGLSLNQFIVNHRFNQLKAPLELFDWFYEPVYGNCFKFNSGLLSNSSSIAILKQSESGKFYGFMGVFFVDTYSNRSYNFMDTIGLSSYGVWISIDGQNTIPVFTNYMIPIAPGMCTFIGLKKVVTQSLPKPYSSCQDLTHYYSVLYDKFVRLNKTYSQRVCYELCKQKKVIDACKCAVMEYPNIDSYSTCQTVVQMRCYWDLVIDASGCEQYCPLECESTYYEYTSSNQLFPDMAYYNYYKSLPQVDLAFLRANIPFRAINFDALSKSLACVYVYFEDMRVTRIVEAKSMTEGSLFSSIGGSLGLCCGVSILSFFELFELLVEMMFIILERGNKVRTNHDYSRKVEKSFVIEAQPGQAATVHAWEVSKVEPIVYANPTVYDSPTVHIPITNNL